MLVKLIPAAVVTVTAIYVISAAFDRIAAVFKALPL